jgi:hypothetical protein
MRTSRVLRVCLPGSAMAASSVGTSTDTSGFLITDPTCAAPTAGPVGVTAECSRPTMEQQPSAKAQEVHWFCGGSVLCGGLTSSRAARAAVCTRGCGSLSTEDRRGTMVGSACDSCLGAQ